MINARLWRGEDEVNLVVTDSGLGGLDVAARLVELVRLRRLCHRLNVVFVNCKPAAKIGYHSLDQSQRAIVFNRALQAMANRFNPNAILIACNTLWDIYKQTDFAREGEISVQGIIHAGCDMISDYLTCRQDSQVVLLATPITCDADVHRRELVMRGYDASRIIVQPCNHLAGAIEREGAGAESLVAMDLAVDQTLKARRDQKAPLAAALLCTHFGYVSDHFVEAFARRGVELVTVLNPNQRMAEQCAQAAEVGDCSPSIRVRVVSQAGHSETGKKAIAPMLEQLSPQTAQALLADVTEALFDID